MSLCSFCFRPFGKKTGNTCEVCQDSLHKECWAQIEARKITGCGHQNYIPSVVYATEDLVISAENGGILHVWDLNSGVDRIVRGHGEILRLLVTPDRSRLIAVGGVQVTILSLPDLKVEQKFENINQGISYAALDQSGSRVAFSGGKFLHLIDLAQKTMSEVGGELPNYPQKISLSPDGQRIAVLLPEGKILIRDADVGMDICQPDLSSLSTYFNNFLFIKDGAEIFLDNYNTLYAIDGMNGQLLWQEKINLSPTGLYETPQKQLLLVNSGLQQEVQIKTLDRGKSPAISEAESYRGHIAALQGVSFLDENRLLTWSSDKSILLIDRARGEARLLMGHRGSFWVSPDTKARRLWTLDRQPGLTALCIHEDKVLLHALSAYPSKLEICSLDTGEPLEDMALSLYPQKIHMLSFSGKHWLVLLSGDGSLALLQWPEKKQLWQAKGRAEERSLPCLLATPDPEDPLLVLVGVWNSFGEAYRLRNGEQVWSFSTEELGSSGALFSTLEGELIWLGKSKDYTQSGYLPRRLSVTGAMKEYKRVSTDMSWSQDHTAITPDGVHIVAGPLYLPGDSGGGFGVFDWREATLVGRSVVGHKPSLRGLAVSPVGHLVASGSDDRCVRLWDARTGQPLAVFSGFTQSPINKLYFSPDGGTLISSTDSGQLDVWDLVGLDERTDFFLALCQARSGGEEAKRAARVKLASLRPPWSLEALAGVLLFTYLYPDSPVDLSPLLSREDLTAQALSPLAKDFDRRVRAAFAQRFQTSGE